MDQDAMRRLIGRSDAFQKHLVKVFRLFSGELKPEMLTDVMDEVADRFSRISTRTHTAKPSNYIQARSILGEDFITPEEIMRADKSISYTEQHQLMLQDTVPSIQDLWWCKNNDYALMPAPPNQITLSSIRGLWYVGPHFPLGRGKYAVDRHITDTIKSGWFAIRKQPVPESVQLSEVEGLPNAVELAWFITTYYKICGVRLFAKDYGRTASVFQHQDGKYPVAVGYFSDSSLYLSTNVATHNPASIRRF